MHSTTVRSAGICRLSLAAAEAPVANTLSTRSAGRRSRSARSDGTSRAVAARSISRDRRLPVRRCAKCRPSYRPGIVTRRPNSRSPAPPATGPISDMLSAVRARHPDRRSNPAQLRAIISWPSPNDPVSNTASCVTSSPGPGSDCRVRA